MSLPFLVGAYRNVIKQFPISNPFIEVLFLMHLRGQDTEIVTRQEVDIRFCCIGVLARAAYSYTTVHVLYCCFI